MLGGRPHICFWEGVQERKTYGSGRVSILDDRYRMARVIFGGHGRALDFHELQVVDDGIALLATFYQPRLVSVKPSDTLDSTTAMWILQSGFQKLDIDSGRVLFEWVCTDHIPPDESNTNSTGKGGSILNAWDYFHLNSVEQTGADYIISARHTSTIYKVSGLDGSIIWRLGGKDSDYSADFSMNYQHDVRVLGESETTTMLSVFDNGWNGEDNVGTRSSGMALSLDHSTKLATMQTQYLSGSERSSSAMGNLQFIPGCGNSFVNWGKHTTFMTEHLENATMISNISVASGASPIFRAYQALWRGFPTTQPDLWCFMTSTSSPVQCYVSWNGATEVAWWRFYASRLEATSDEKEATHEETLGQVPWEGFETLYTHESHVWNISAVALAADNTLLAQSAWVVPSILSESTLTIFDEDGRQAQQYEDKSSRRIDGNEIDRFVQRNRVDVTDISRRRFIESSLAIIGGFYLMSRLLKAISRLGRRPRSIV